MTVWALFDSGNGSYTKGVKALDANIDIYPIGIDIEGKNNHFINLNLADYNRLFGNNTLFDTLLVHLVKVGLMRVQWTEGMHAGNKSKGMHCFNHKNHCRYLP